MAHKITIDSSEIPRVIDEMVSDINTGFHSSETRVLGQSEGIQIQITVTTDEYDFIEGGHCHRTEVFDLHNQEG